MIYRKLFDWIDGDDACEVTSVTLYSAHDPGHDEEQDFIIRRVKSLIETGATIQNITLTVWPNRDDLPHYHMEISDDFTVTDIVDNNHKHSLTAFPFVIDNIYKSGESIEKMIIKVGIKEDGH